MRVKTKEVKGKLSQKVRIEQFDHRLDLLGDFERDQIVIAHIERSGQSHDFIPLGVLLALFDLIEIGDGQPGSFAEFLARKPLSAA